MKLDNDELLALAVAGIGPVTEAVEHLEKILLPEFKEDDRTRTDAWKMMLYIITAYLRVGGESAGNAKNDIEIELALQSKAVEARLLRLKEIDMIDIAPYPSNSNMDGRTRRVKPTQKGMARFREYAIVMYHATRHYAKLLESLNNIDIPEHNPKPGDEFLDVLPNGVSDVVFDDFALIEQETV